VVFVYSLSTISFSVQTSDMKKATTIVTLALLVFACSRKTVDTSQTTAGTTPVTETAKTDAAHAALVEQGKGIYTTKCSKCHGAKDVTAYTTTRWEGILKSMIPKAKLDETESQQVTAYVMEYAKK
jgi:mono/diheme cytochrome c family protein